VLSPDHALFVERHLVPVRYLLNGATIVQEAAGWVRYFHVELATHDILLAEGMPAESYLDTGNRSAFANGGTVAMAAPEFARGCGKRRAMRRYASGVRCWRRSGSDCSRRPRAWGTR